MSPEQGPAARRWIAQGRVQGVGYRWFIHDRARSLRVGGWVRNLPDGSVEIVGCGAPDQLAALERDIGRGPPGARVTSLSSGDVPHEAVDANSFIIKR